MPPRLILLRGDKMSYGTSAPLSLDESMSPICISLISIGVAGGRFASIVVISFIIIDEADDDGEGSLKLKLLMVVMEITQSLRWILHYYLYLVEGRVFPPK
jgi:hypothetical protein